MAKLLVNQPSGLQELIELDETGKYYDESRVLWDERIDGPMPDITPGKMQRSGGILITLTDFLPEHAAAVYRANFPVEVPIASACEALINAGLYDSVNTYINTLDDVSKAWWQRTDKIHRLFPMVETVRADLNLTNQQIDDLFIAAEQIRKQRAGIA